MSYITDWLTSIGTIGATCAAVWFGFRGNRDTWVLIKRITDQLDREAFIFLCDLPQITEKDAESYYRNELTQKHINKFSKKIINNGYIGNKEVHKYNSFIELANNFFFAKKEKNKSAQKYFFSLLQKYAIQLSFQVDIPTKSLKKKPC